MQRVREFGDLRSSRQSKRSNLGETSLTRRQIQTPRRDFDRTSMASSTQSFYICMNCQNLNMSAEKNRQCRQRQFLERSRFRQLQNSRRVYEDHLRRSQEKLMQNEKKKVLDTNQKMIDGHNQAKQKQKLAVQHEQEMEKQRQRQNAILIEQNLVQDQKRRMEFRESLQKQIEDKNQARLRQQMQDRYQDPIDDSNEKRYLQLSRQKVNEYKEGLMDQIKMKQEKKKQEKLKEAQEQKTAFALLELAQERAKEMMAEQNRRKASLQEEMKKLAESAEQKKVKEQIKREQQRVQALIDKEFQEKQCQQNEKLRNAKLNKYRYDIKKQIEDKEKQRAKQRIKDRYQTSYNMTIAQIQRKLCDSCEKPYPSTYMTRYKRKKK